jgi:hypothetical protein
LHTAAAACLAAASLVIAAACTSPSDGTLTGQVKMYGGPFNPTTGRQSLNGAPGPGWTVIVRSGSQEVARTTSDASGRFSFHLPPGTYTLVCSVPQPVTVHADVETAVACIAEVS